MHRLLEQQIQQAFGSFDAIPENLRGFVEAVDAAYHGAESDKARIERALDDLSAELTQRNQTLSNEKDEQWRALFGSDRPARGHLMDENEHFTFGNLPETVEIYRGCQEGINEDGLSWTLDPEKAKFFAERFGKPGKVLKKAVNKAQIVALFSGRNEAEVICL
jgi:hypothetical protein